MSRSYVTLSVSKSYVTRLFEVDTNFKNVFKLKTFIKKMVSLLTSHEWSHMVTNVMYDQVWSRTILVQVIYNLYLSWPSINDNDRHRHKTRCQQWYEVVAHHVIVSFMSLHLRTMQSCSTGKCLCLLLKRCRISWAVVIKFDIYHSLGYATT